MVLGVVFLGYIWGFLLDFLGVFFVFLFFGGVGGLWRCVLCEGFVVFFFFFII